MEMVDYYAKKLAMGCLKLRRAGETEWYMFDNTMLYFTLLISQRLLDDFAYCEGDLLANCATNVGTFHKRRLFEAF